MGSKSHASRSAAASPKPVKVQSNRMVDHYCEQPLASEVLPGLYEEEHMYMAELVCSGLPDESFTSASFGQKAGNEIESVHGWCWLSLPKALGEHWRNINLMEGRVFASNRNWKDLRSALREISQELAIGLERLPTVTSEANEGAPKVKATDLSELLQKCLDSARRASKEHSQILEGSTSVYNNPKVQSFVRTTAAQAARMDTALADQRQTLVPLDSAR